MDTPKVSEMWADLQQISKMPQTGLLAGCQSELEELMCQIDGMVQSRKVEWEREKHMLQAKLDIREQEFSIQRSTLQQKHTEIGQLRAQVENLERVNRDATTHHEHQLSSLRTEVDHMKKEYERLQKRYGQKSSRDKSAKSAESSNADHKMSSDMKRLTARVEEYKKKSVEWDQERRSLRRQLESAESQQKTFEDKYNLAQQQSGSYKSQLDKRKEILDTTESTLKSQILHLEGQLHRSRDTVNNQETQLSRLRGSIDEALNAQRRALEEKELVEAELRKAQHAVRCIEEEVAEGKMTIEANDEVARITQKDLQKATVTAAKHKEEIISKDAVIQTLEDKINQLENDDIIKLKDSLSSNRTEYRSLKKSEQGLQIEVGQLRTELNSLHKQNSLLKSQLDNKMCELENIESQDLVLMRSEVKKLREELAISKQRHLGEQEGMKSELATITAELLQRTQAMASVTEKATAMEKQLREQDESIEKKSAEYQVATAQLEALRVENRHLRRSALNMSSVSFSNDKTDAGEAERHLQDLQVAYDSSIKTLEEENERLGEDMARLKHHLHLTDNQAQQKLHAALTESQRTISLMREAEQKRIDEIRRHSGQQVEELQRHLSSTVHRYQDEISELRQHLSHLEGELDSRNNTLTRMGLENEAMTQFVTGVDHLVQLPGQPMDETQQQQQQQRNGLYEYDLEDDEDDCIDTAERATANFLAQQENRAKELEDRLNLHIEDLRLATQEMLQGHDLSQGNSSSNS